LRAQIKERPLPEIVVEAPKKGVCTVMNDIRTLLTSRAYASASPMAHALRVCGGEHEEVHDMAIRYVSLMMLNLCNGIAIQILQSNLILCCALLLVVFVAAERRVTGAIGFLGGLFVSFLLGLRALEVPCECVICRSVSVTGTSSTLPSSCRTSRTCSSRCWHAPLFPPSLAHYAITA
jgi:hypothetical protein